MFPVYSQCRKKLKIKDLYNYIEQPWPPDLAFNVCLINYLMVSCLRLHHIYRHFRRGLDKSILLIISNKFSKQINLVEPYYMSNMDIFANNVNIKS